MASPSYLPSFALSQKYIFILETPLSFKMTSMLGLTTYESDDDGDDPSDNNYYCLHWNPEVGRTCGEMKFVFPFPIQS